MHLIKPQRLHKGDTVATVSLSIKPLASSKITDIRGGQIIISGRFPNDSVFKSLPKSVNTQPYKDIINQPTSVMHINSVEADSIYAESIRADRISGEDIVIGDLCIIERVEYGKHIRISEKAIVNEVVKR